MKHTITLVLLFVLGHSTMAQKNYKRVHNTMLDEAKALLSSEDYESAAKIYKRLIPLDSSFGEVFHEMGLCLVGIPGRKGEAAPYFEQAVLNGNTEAHYQLALSRHREERFDESIELFRRYKQLSQREQKDQEVDRRIAMCQSAKELTARPIEATIRNMGAGINSTGHDYCPLVTGEGNTMFFTSRRKGTTGDLKDGTGMYLEDIYTVHKEEGIWGTAANMRTPLNTRVHDATVGLDPSGSSMIIYRTSPNLVSGGLYETRLHAGKWQEPELMTERINSKYHEPSASIAPGGDEIYFTSDRPGGYGGRDLYRIRRLPNGEWSLPLNLGPNVNTPFDEDAPFMHSDGITLYFSSNGHNTMGGFDVFSTVLTDADMNVWSKPANIGAPVNTVNDDIYFCLSQDGTTGWFSSERDGGLGMQDIYQVDFPGSQLEYVVVRGVVTDGLEEPLKARLIVSHGTEDELVGVYNTNERSGRYLLVLAPGERYNLRVEAQGYAAYETDIRARMIDGSREMSLDMQLTPIEQLSQHE